MSKLYPLYLQLKRNEPNTIFLFKSGIFYVALDEDAYYLSNLFSFKLTNLNENIKKIGFPCNSIDKNINLFKTNNINFKIIDTNTDTAYSLSEYKQNKEISEILDTIKKLNIETLSISEAYSFLYNIKKKIINL